MTKTNIGLVEYAKKQLGNPYWYGTFGQTGTESLLTYKAKQYPSYYSKTRQQIAKEKHIGKRVHDCIGLMKGYIWSDTADSEPKYNSAQDKSANGTYSAAKKKGNISTLPEVPGICLHKNGHVGIYIGNGEVIEARGFDYGVVKTKLSERGWLHWFEYPYIDYITEKGAPETFKKYTGHTSSIVDALNTMGEDSSFAYRKKIAAKNGINPYSGTAEQNLKMVAMLKEGKLLKP